MVKKANSTFLQTTNFINVDSFAQPQIILQYKKSGRMNVLYSILGEFLERTNLTLERTNLTLLSKPKLFDTFTATWEI